MQDVVSSRGRAREPERENLQELERSLEDEDRANQSRRWPGVVSIIAIVFSAVSLYETVVKPAELTLNVGEIVQYARDPVTNAEVLAIPITIGNRGARDATVTGLELRLEAGAKSRIFRASFVGSAKEPEPFAPWPVAGRGAHGAIVRFFSASEPQDGDRQALIDAPAIYHVCLSVRADTGREFGLLDRILQSPLPALSFFAALAWFSASDLAVGKSIPMRTQDISASEGACR